MTRFRLFSIALAISLAFVVLKPAIACELARISAGEGRVDGLTASSELILVEYEVYKDALKSGEPFLKRDLFLHVYNNRPLLNDELDLAVGLLEESAAEGYAPSQYTLGELLIKGDVLRKNVDCGRTWLMRAAEGGYDKAIFLIGRSYTSEYYNTPKHQKKDRVSAFEYAESWLAQADSIRAREPEVAIAADVVLGRLYISRSIDDENGWLLLERALNAGSLEAMQTLRALEDVLKGAVDDGKSSAAKPLSKVQSLLETQLQ